MHRLLSILTIAALLAGVAACERKADPPPPGTPESARAIYDFNERVAAYAELRQKADDGVPRLKTTNEPADIVAAQESLAQRIAAARADAKRGDIFTPVIATQFRRILRPEVKDEGTKELIREDNPGSVPFEVNAPYPEREPLSTVPPNVLARLPELPADVEYRFVGRHLILFDARANLVIDYIPNAIA